ncbi:MAG: hypothetical protein NWE89_01705 [Candidatus Bathyarchaeota archaeon]|nr:hypothetical protein [Candidatus Bathyarchaeota archaeon]
MADAIRVRTISGMDLILTVCDDGVEEPSDNDALKAFKYVLVF